MIALLLSIVSSTFIFIAFKLFNRFNINTFQAIVCNYLVAGTLGIFIQGEPAKIINITQFSWFSFALLLGSFFISIFFLMAITTQKSGLSVVAIATKMSFIIPILFGFWYYNESINGLKGLGIVLAFVAVYLASIKNKTNLVIKKANIIYPLLVFLGSGIIDTSIKFIEEAFVAPEDVALFSSTLFFAAATIGVLVIVFKKIKGALNFELKSILGGLLLGIPNFFSVYFLVLALRSDIFSSSGIFTVNNIGIVSCSTLVGVLLFKERLITKNWLGLLVALISILCIALSKSI